MCRPCEESCWRDGGERECSLSDAEFEAAMNAMEEASGVIDLMERLQHSLSRAKRVTKSPPAAIQASPKDKP